MMNLNIVFIEIRRKTKLMIALTIIMLLYALMMLAFYDSMAGQAEELQSYIEAIGEGFLAIFSSDLDNIFTLEGFLNTEFVSLLLMANAIIAAYMGASTIGKEIGDKSISLVLSKPVSRISTYLSKFTALTLVLFAINAIIAVGSFLLAKIFVKTADPQLQFFIVLFLGLFIFQVLFLSFGQLLSVKWKDSTALFGSAGLLIAALLFNFLQSVEEVPRQVQYLNPYYYLSTNTIANSHSLKTPHIFVLILATAVLVAIGLWVYKRKDVNV